LETFHGARQATDNMAHAHCMLDNYGYKHTLRISNAYCFSTTLMVTRSRLSITLLLLCLSCVQRTVNEKGYQGNFYVAFGARKL